MKKELVLKPAKLSFEDLYKVWHDGIAICLDNKAYEKINASSDAVAKVLEKGVAAYGINTGFGLLAKQRINDNELKLLQRNLILSHCVGVGSNISEQIVRLIMVMKIASLAQGYSGIRAIVIDTLIEHYNADIIAAIPEKGSVGASGDLAPLSHMTLALMGEGNVIVNGKLMEAKAALKKANIKPIELAAKEGLALINGTQVSTAFALHALFLSKRLLMSSAVIGALSVDAAKGSDTPFDKRIHLARGHRTQIEVAATYRKLLRQSEIRQSHIDNDDKVQDPYSLRCQPQVLGAILSLWQQSCQTLLIEANGVTDNPLIFENQNKDGYDVLSGGNFHAQPVAFAADVLALAIAEIGSISERRVALLIDATLSGLPPFLVRQAGVNSGFMIAHVTAAALASENKSLAHPASVDSLPTSANQEDHVSMATFAARRLDEMIKNTAHIVAIEYLCAAQGIDFHLPLKTSAKLQKAQKLLRDKVSFYEVDRLLAPDIELAASIVLADDMDVLFEKECEKWFVNYI